MGIQKYCRGLAETASLWGAVLAILLALPVAVTPVQAQRSPDQIMKRLDRDGDGRISADEFIRRRKPFEFFDSNSDGFITRDELAKGMDQVRQNSAGRPERNQSKPAGNSGGKPARGLDGLVSRDRIDEETFCAISRNRRCYIDQAIRRGLSETGLRPRFPDGLDCRGIDEAWAISYGHKRDREAYHGGIDMPAPFDTPIVSAAAGTVVAKFGDGGMRGIELILRHSPADTGLPLWIYTGYSHFNAFPALEIGARVKMGDVLGPTGNSGKTPSGGRKQRRPAIHFAAWFSTSPDFFVARRAVIPADGKWMDPNALYRGAPPFDSGSMKALPESDKRIAVPVMLEDRTTIPAGTKLIWPYKCSRR